MTDALALMQDHYRARDTAARAWKAKGGKVVGYFCDSVPEEMIMAAGFLPYRISGDPDAGTESVRKYLLPLWNKSSLAQRQVSLEFINSMLHLIFTGRYDFVDYLVIPYTRKAILGIHKQLSDAKQHYPDLKIPTMFILDRTLTPFFAGAQFDRDRAYDFKAKLEEWSGKPLTDTALAAAIKTVNQSKALLKRVADLRAEDPPRLSGVEALQIFGSAKFMPLDEHNAALQAFLGEIEKRPARRGARIYVAGSPLDNTELYGLIEATGATVVSENHCWGNRCSDLPIDESMVPMEAIASRYHRMPPCITFPLDKAVRNCTARAVTAKAQGAVFNVYRFDNFQIFDIPHEMEALKEKGIPSLYLQEQPYKIAEPDQIKSKLSSFVDSLKHQTLQPA
jgi:benzoyl-CoA reductase/2-hydroxyglutaryl-CoA dehydratase subunit BcrC/BadD/HgdB